MAKTSSNESYPDLTAYFTLIELSYDEFNNWREKRGFHEPNFWEPPQERETWQAKPGCLLSKAEIAVLRAINEIWPDGILDRTAKARDQRILKSARDCQTGQRRTANYSADAQKNTFPLDCRFCRFCRELARKATINCGFLMHNGNARGTT